MMSILKLAVVSLLCFAFALANEDEVENNALIPVDQLLALLDLDIREGQFEQNQTITHPDGTLLELNSVFDFSNNTLLVSEVRFDQKGKITSESGYGIIEGQPVADFSGQWLLREIGKRQIATIRKHVLDYVSVGSILRKAQNINKSVARMAADVDVPLSIDPQLLKYVELIQAHQDQTFNETRDFKSKDENLSFEIASGVISTLVERLPGGAVRYVNNRPLDDFDPPKILKDMLIRRGATDQFLLIERPFPSDYSGRSFGFTYVRYLDGGVFVSGVRRNSEASSNSIEMGDEILSLNGEVVLNMSDKVFREKLSESSKLEFKIRKPDGAEVEFALNKTM